MLISIIIPVYNVEPYIESCIRSVVAQTYQEPIECILVDDCGSDNSIEIAQKLIYNYKGSIRFRILHHDHNRGLSAARNTGMETAKGDYIFFLDSDDELTPDCIEKLAEPLKEELYDLIIGNIHTIGDEKLDEVLQLKIPNGTALRGADIQKTYRWKWNVMAQNKLYRTNFLRREKLTFKEGLIHEDELWSFQIACLIQSLRAIGDYTYQYYIRQGSITAKSTNDKKAAAMEIVAAESCKFLLERNIFSASSYRNIQSFVQFILLNHLGNKQDFIKTYLQLRRDVKFSMYYRIRANGWHIRTQFREFHYFLNPILGARILYQRMKV